MRQGLNFRGDAAIPPSGVGSVIARNLETSKRNIGIVVFPKFSSFDAAIVAEIFHHASELLEARKQAGYGVSWISTSGGVVSSSSRMSIWSDELPDSSSIHALLIVGGEGAIAACRDPVLMRWLEETYSQTAIVMPIAEGNLILRAATVHRARSKTLQKGLANRVELTANVKLLRLPTAGRYDPNSVLAAALSIVEYDWGLSAAREIAERLASSSAHGLGPILGEHDSNSSGARISHALRWIDENFDRPITVKDAAQIANMTERTFLRHFTVLMQVTPLKYLSNIRFEQACRLLVSTNLPVDKIARRCGLSSGTVLAKLFRDRLAISATEYRVTTRIMSHRKLHSLLD